MKQVLGKIGVQTIRRINHLLDLFAFTSRILGLMIRKPKTGRHLLNRIIIEQIYFTAVQALYVIIPIALIIGTLMIFQFTQISGQYDLGKITAILIIREIGPLLTALVVILRSATSITIEAGYMNALHEVEAVEMSGIDPLHFMGPPRLIGITSAMLCLFIIFDLAAIIGGYAVVWMISNVPMGNFLGQVGKALTGADFVVGIAKGLCFGVAITAASLHRGFSVKKQITEIPVATSKAAVDCLIYCLFLDVFISAAFYL
jgi:phospholipid/cholesterol/gamma-HCH transport system permease protein